MNEHKMKKGRTPDSKNMDILLALMPLLFMAVYYYGLRALALATVAVMTATVTDIVCVLLRKKQLRRTDFSAPVTGLTIALLMPASVSYGVLIFACALAIIVAKQAFGGNEHYIFNPAAVGYAFVSVCWPTQLNLYPKPFAPLPLWGNVTEGLSASFEHTANLAAVPAVSDIDIYLGRFLGPMGGTHILVLLVCAICLMFRRSISPAIFLTSTATIAGIAYLFPRVGDSRFTAVAFEMIGGMLLFGLIFLASDPSILPKTRTGRFWYGLLIGLLTMAFKYFTTTESAIVFALLIVNALSDTLDSRVLRFASRIRSRVNALEQQQDAAELHEHQVTSGEEGKQA